MFEIEISNYKLTMQNYLKTYENNNEMLDEEEKYQKNLIMILKIFI